MLLKMFKDVFYEEVEKVWRLCAVCFILCVCGVMCEFPWWLVGVLLNVLDCWAMSPKINIMTHILIHLSSKLILENLQMFTYFNCTLNMKIMNLDPSKFVYIQ